MPPLSPFKLRQSTLLMFLGVICAPYASIGAAFYVSFFLAEISGINMCFLQMSKAEPNEMTRFNEVSNMPSKFNCLSVFQRFADEWDPAIIARLDCFLITSRDSMPVAAYCYYVLGAFVPLFGIFFIFAVSLPVKMRFITIVFRSHGTPWSSFERSEISARKCNCSIESWPGLWSCRFESRFFFNFGKKERIWQEIAG